jgi:hypothetical protein
MGNALTCMRACMRVHVCMLDTCSGQLFFHLREKTMFNEKMVQFYAAELLLAIGHLVIRACTSCVRLCV